MNDMFNAFAAFAKQQHDEQAATEELEKYRNRLEVIQARIEEYEGYLFELAKKKTILQKELVAWGQDDEKSWKFKADEQENLYNQVTNDRQEISDRTMALLAKAESFETSLASNYQRAKHMCEELTEIMEDMETRRERCAELQDLVETNTEQLKAYETEQAMLQDEIDSFKAVERSAETNVDSLRATCTQELEPEMKRLKQEMEEMEKQIMRSQELLQAKKQAHHEKSVSIVSKKGFLDPKQVLVGEKLEKYVSTFCVNQHISVEAREALRKTKLDLPAELYDGFGSVFREELITESYLQGCLKQAKKYFDQNMSDLQKRLNDDFQNDVQMKDLTEEIRTYVKQLQS